MGQSLELLEQHLRNRRILVVEDEASTVVMTEAALSEMGCRVFLAQDIRRAHKLATTKVLDCALLDVRIGDDTVFLVADILAANNVPFVFTSGYAKSDLPTRYQDRMILSKPYLFANVVRALVAAMNPETHPRPPEGFRIADAAEPGAGDA